MPTESFVWVGVEGTVLRQSPLRRFERTERPCKAQQEEASDASGPLLCCALFALRWGLLDEERGACLTTAVADSLDRVGACAQPVVPDIDVGYSAVVGGR